MVLAPHVVIPSDSQGPVTPQRRESVVGFANSTDSYSIQLLQPFSRTMQLQLLLKIPGGQKGGLSRRAEMGRSA
jgi:hypothetical protein